MKRLLLLLGLAALVAAEGGEPCACPHALHRVCGSDGETYSNPCTLNCAKFNGKPELVKVHDGPCEPDEDEDVCQECDGDEYKPVCGSDDITYDNNCRLECASISSSPGVELKHEGPCRTEEKKILKRSDEFEMYRCACPKIYYPVCGTDGETYPNLCVLECHMRMNPGLQLHHYGHCQHHHHHHPPPHHHHHHHPHHTTEKPVEPCACPHALHRVCGSDGETYSNPCTLNCAKHNGKPGLVKVHDGPCEPDEDEDVCQECDDVDYEPVCGTDDKTYDNNCRLECASISSSPGVELNHEGPCSTEEKKLLKRSGKLKKSCPCPRIFAPVCGTDGTTYANLCILKCQMTVVPGLELKHTGKCLPHLDFPDPGFGVLKVVTGNYDINPTACPKFWLPVCGTDGQTYFNECTLFSASKTQNPSLDVVYFGPCPPKSDENQEPCRCNKYVHPVCGTDGKTYRNLCLLYCTAEANLSEVQFAYDGECQNKDLKKEVDEFTRLFDEAKQEIGKFESDPCNCPKIWKPVCGTNSRTYANECTLNCANSKGNPNLRVAHRTLCEYIPLEELRRNKHSCACSKLDLPVCGTDGETYGNPCVLYCAAITQKHGLELAEYGACSSSQE
ncbi:serine protease inhibitor dipetalogastin-like isoform X3 [Rhodnius prolixus]|uniref:serine protease inhibitor dipetalogastin-like isoform X3 n=1 Tax=Rhodnius prolixus TaxID=13249 RepID=UPI003D18F8DA